MTKPIINYQHRPLVYVIRNFSGAEYRPPQVVGSTLHKWDLFTWFFWDFIKAILRMFMVFDNLPIKK